MNKPLIQTPDPVIAKQIVLITQIYSQVEQLFAQVSFLRQNIDQIERDVSLLRQLKKGDV